MKKVLKYTTTITLFVLLAACAQSFQAQGSPITAQSTISITPSPPTSTLVIPTATITVSPTDIVKSKTVEWTTVPGLDPAYYDGIIAITKYYTYLGHGYHEETFWLLSEDARRPHNLEEYVKNKQMFFKTVEIISIVPYCVHVAQQGGQCSPDPPNTLRFTVEIRAWGEGKMSGSVMSGAPQMIFMALVWEDDEWKINTFYTSPFPRSTSTPAGPDCPSYISDSIYVINPSSYVNANDGLELGISEAINVLQLALYIHQPQWGEFTYQDSKGNERGLGYYFWNYADAQTIKVNPRVWIVAAGLKLDWSIPTDNDLRARITEVGVTLTQHYRDYEFNEDIKSAHPNVPDPANYALYAFFDYDQEKLIEWCVTYVEMFNESPLSFPDPNIEQ